MFWLEWDPFLKGVWFSHRYLTVQKMYSIYMLLCGVFLPLAIRWHALLSYDTNGKHKKISPKHLAINSMTDSSSQSLLTQSSTFIRTDWPQGGDRTPHPHLLYLSSALSLLTPPNPLLHSLLNHQRWPQGSSIAPHWITRELRKLPARRVDTRTLRTFAQKHFGECLCVHREEIRRQLYLLVNPFLMISITVSGDAERQWCKMDEARGAASKQPGHSAGTGLTLHGRQSENAWMQTGEIPAAYDSTELQCASCRATQVLQKRAFKYRPPSVVLCN